MIITYFMILTSSVIASSAEVPIGASTPPDSEIRQPKASSGLPPLSPPVLVMSSPAPTSPSEPTSNLSTDLEEVPGGVSDPDDSLGAEMPLPAAELIVPPGTVGMPTSEPPTTRMTTTLEPTMPLTRLASTSYLISRILLIGL
jgi:hypothetical protein